MESEEVVETRPKTQVLSAQVNAGKAVANVGAAIGPAVDSATAYESLPASSKRRTIVLTAFRVSLAARPLLEGCLHTITATRMARLSEGVLSRNGQTRARRSTRARTQPRRDLEAYPPLPDWGDSVFSPALAKNRSARQELELDDPRTDKLSTYPT